MKASALSFVITHFHHDVKLFRALRLKSFTFVVKHFYRITPRFFWDLMIVRSVRKRGVGSVRKCVRTFGQDESAPACCSRRRFASVIFNALKVLTPHAPHARLNYSPRSDSTSLQTLCSENAPAGGSYPCNQSMSLF